MCPEWGIGHSHANYSTTTDFPLVGRIHDVPESMSHLKFYEWSKTYGPIYQMKIFGTVHVWISSEQIAHELLSKKSLIYSDRPVIPNLPDNRTSGNYLALLGRNGECLPSLFPLPIDPTES